LDPESLAGPRILAEERRRRRPQAPIELEIMDFSDPGAIGSP
jgi:hypothetical protein